MATKESVEGRASLTTDTPLIDLTKEQIIREGIALGVDYSLTSSCYDPEDEAIPADLVILFTQAKGFSCGCSRSTNREV